MLLVTGANGQLGRRVVAHLLERVPAERIAVSVREPDKAADLAALGISVRRGDFDEPTGLPAAFEGAERLLLISSAALPHSLRHQHHVRAAEAAASAGVGHLVYTSLALAAPDSIGAVHRASEESIAGTGLGHTFLRHPLYTENFLAGALEETELISATGDGRVASATRDDLAEAAAVVLAGASTESRAYDLAGPGWTFAELAAELTSVTGRVVTHRAVDGAELAALLRAEEVPEFLVRILVDIQTTIASGALAVETADLGTLLGRRPRGLREAVAALRS